MAAIQFLSVEDVLLIHDDTLHVEGGLAGLRDSGLLESAVMMPQQQFGGQYLHDGLAGMAAAYLYHIARNHPFNDGNKRVAVMAALVFLDADGVNNLPDPGQLEAITWGVASGIVAKTDLAEWFRQRVDEKGQHGKK